MCFNIKMLLKTLQDYQDMTEYFLSKSTGCRQIFSKELPTIGYSKILVWTWNYNTNIVPWNG